MRYCSRSQIENAAWLWKYAPALAITFSVVSCFTPATGLMKSARSQPIAPPIKNRSAFSPYQPEPKFAPSVNPQTPPTAQNAPTEPDFIESPEQPRPQTEPFNITPDGPPALNVVPAAERPPIPPPPSTPPLRPTGNGVARPPQAWRVKAFQLFKQKLDPNTTLSIVLNAPYQSAMNGLRQAAEDAGLTVSGVSTSSGHMLLTFSDLNSNRTEKAIASLRPYIGSSDINNGSNGDSGNSKVSSKGNNASGDARTEMRILCEARNKSLNMARMNEILAKLQNKFGDSRSNAEL